MKKALRISMILLRSRAPTGLIALAMASESVGAAFVRRRLGRKQRTRKSVSGGLTFLNGQHFYSYSRTQKTVALPSTEAEYRDVMS